MINYQVIIFSSIFFIFLTTLLIQIDRRIGVPRDMTRLCFQYVVIITIVRPFFYSGVELVFQTLISWFGVYTGYLLNSFYINRRERS